MKTPQHTLTVPARERLTTLARETCSDVSFEGSDKSVLMITILPIEPIPKIAM